MNKFRRVVAIAFFFVGLSAALPAGEAQELWLGLGGVSNVETSDSSYAWSLTYIQRVGRSFGASVGWMNEGHPSGHHRDGLALQMWVGRRFSPRFAGGLGLGVYRFYDTVFLGDLYRNVHGTGPMASLSGAFELTPRWNLHGTVTRNWTGRKGTFKGAALLFGVGFRFLEEWRLFDNPSRAKRKLRTTESELTAFVGQTIVNSTLSEKAVATGLEFRHGIEPHLDWTLTLLNEGDPQITRRKGLATQVWLVNWVAKGQLMLGAGAGVYYHLDRRRVDPSGGPGGKRDFAGLVAVGASWRFPGLSFIRLIWNRIVTDYSKDSDVILLGLGCRL